MPRGPASAPNSGRTADPEIYTADPGIKEDLVHPRDNDVRRFFFFFSLSLSLSPVISLFSGSFETEITAYPCRR